MKSTIRCDWCGKEISRYPSQIKKHNFCSRKCLSDFSNKSINPTGYYELKDYTNMAEHLSELNRKLNPTKMTKEMRAKMRKVRLGTGEGKTYTKYYGRHAHRVVAEQKLGRKLKKNEVVHHIDGNRRNNNPDNLMVFSSSADHMRYHVQIKKFFEKGEIPLKIVKEVMPL
ncbi:HNH endonuclease [Lacrimispora defluvii]|uniref:HNH endonuclease n=1 Tax=Lacrimispora defluvii TaxID=2719233 RepID=A0ABX1VY57_9FIRM|nr:HNH endonuclease [Lacrimispora defluvii]NNJ30458.1 HNH endonuclease [Lacrimispora defluvii]NNJ33378.1 HNH endonuclease [Lacrimispora defluvii]